MKKTIWVACLAIAMSGTAMAADITPPPQLPFFGFVEGGYVFDSPIDQWQTFGPAVIAPNGTGLSSVGPGWRGKIELGYKIDPTWDIIVAGEYGAENFGAVSTGSRNGRLSANHLTLDGLIGYDLSPEWRAAFGARWANWNNTVNVDLGGPVNIHHNFYGIGPRLQIDGSNDLGNGMSLESGAGASVLFGHIYTNATAGWFCNSCNTETVTAFDLDASLGVGFHVASSAKAVVGLQAQYWSGVNVAKTDNDGHGLNQGTSAELLAGPFIRLQF